MIVWGQGSGELIGNYWGRRPVEVPTHICNSSMLLLYVFQGWYVLEVVRRSYQARPLWVNNRKGLRQWLHVDLGGESSSEWMPMSVVNELDGGWISNLTWVYDGSHVWWRYSCPTLLHFVLILMLRQLLLVGLAWDIILDKKAPGSFEIARWIFGSSLLLLLVQIDRLKNVILSLALSIVHYFYWTPWALWQAWRLPRQHVILRSDDPFARRFEALVEWHGTCICISHDVTIVENVSIFVLHLNNLINLL